MSTTEKTMLIQFQVYKIMLKYFFLPFKKMLPKNSKQGSSQSKPLLPLHEKLFEVLWPIAIANTQKLFVQVTKDIEKQRYTGSNEIIRSKLRTKKATLCSN